MLLMRVTKGAEGDTGPGGRAELRCGICGHGWWSKHPEALRKARIAVRSQKPRLFRIAPAKSSQFPLLGPLTSLRRLP
jgi:hypothetical protein